MLPPSADNQAADDMTGLTGPGASLQQQQPPAAPQPTPLQSAAPQPTAIIDGHVRALRSQLTAIAPQCPYGAPAVPVARLHAFRYAVGDVMGAFSANPPPLEHRQLHRLLSAPETREVFTTSGSWATDATGSPIASVPADFFAGLAIAIDADAFATRGSAPPAASSLSAAAPALPSSLMHAAGLRPDEQAALASSLLLPPGSSRGLAHRLLGGAAAAPDGTAADPAANAAAAAAAASGGAAPSSAPPGVYPPRAPPLHKFLSDPHDQRRSQQHALMVDAATGTLCFRDVSTDTAALTVSEFVMCSRAAKHSSLYREVQDDFQSLTDDCLSKIDEGYPLADILAYELAMRQRFAENPDFCLGVPDLQLLHKYLITPQLMRNMRVASTTAASSGRSGVSRSPGSARGSAERMPVRATAAPQPTNAKRQRTATRVLGHPNQRCINFRKGACDPGRGVTCARSHACDACGGAKYPNVSACTAGHTDDLVFVLPKRKVD